MFWNYIGYDCVVYVIWSLAFESEMACIPNLDPNLPSLSHSHNEQMKKDKHNQILLL
jgi:hypothetical protein